jgi:DeoR/GlpR family transcriptional regulator of sugar metabolism
MTGTGPPSLAERHGLDRDSRQQRISELVLEHGALSIKALTAAFGVSQMTVHRDLDELEARGILRKVRGGATAQPSSLFESSVDYRMASQLTAKRAIAREALRHVQPGDSVILDDSTTSFRLAELLPQRAPLTVITNFLPAIGHLHDRRGISLIGLGGRFSPPYGAFLGPLTETSIRSLRASVLFASTSALTQGVLYHQDQEIASSKRALLDAAARRILLVDHSKLDKEALHRVVPASDFDLVIVDEAIRPEALAALRELVPVEVAGQEHGAGGPAGWHRR